MNNKQNKILDTCIYFLDRYKKAVSKSDSQTGFEDMVFDQMIETIKELREEIADSGLMSKELDKLLKGEPLTAKIGDYDLTLRLSQKFKLACTPNTECYYRLHGENLGYLNFNLNMKVLITIIMSSKT